MPTAEEFECELRKSVYQNKFIAYDWSYNIIVAVDDIGDLHKLKLGNVRIMHNPRFDGIPYFF